MRSALHVTNNLQRHPEMRARDAHQYFCDLCGQTCKYYVDLRTHIATHLQDSSGNIEGYFKCPSCPKIYTHVNTLIKHSHTHRSSFSCDICGSLWNNIKQLKDHKNTHYHKANGKFNCNLCNKKYGRRDKLMEHLHVLHSTTRKEIGNICHWCGKAFTRNKYLWIHETIAHLSKGKRYQCDKCGKNFPIKSRLDKHLVTHNGIKKYSCEVCGKEFGQQSSLWRHKPIHTGEKKHSCSYCDFKCIQLYSLKRHLLTHTGQKPHECDLCGEQFRQIFALTKHKRKHHSVS